MEFFGALLGSIVGWLLLGLFSVMIGGGNNGD